MADELAKLKPPELAAFYGRLADVVDKNKGSVKVSLAAMLLRQWLTNRDRSATFVFEAPDHLKSNGEVAKVLKFHRQVYLTQEKARLGANTEKWAGILPRYQGRPGFTKWDLTTPLSLNYESLVELPIISTQVAGSDAEKDILYALHGFQLKSYVTVAGVLVAATKRLHISFQQFEAEISDRYDWDYTEHLTVPNPDFGSTLPNAVAPNSDKVVVYHSNAKRLEDAKLAAPYDLKTKRFPITIASLLAAEEINPAKSL